MKYLGMMGYLLLIGVGSFLILESSAKFITNGFSSLTISPFAQSFVLSLLTIISLISKTPSALYIHTVGNDYNPLYLTPLFLYLLIVAFSIILLVAGVAGLKRKWWGNILSYVCISIIAISTLLTKSYLIFFITAGVAAMVFYDRKNFKD